MHNHQKGAIDKGTGYGREKGSAICVANYCGQTEATSGEHRVQDPTTSGTDTATRANVKRSVGEKAIEQLVQQMKEKMDSTRQ